MTSQTTPPGELVHYGVKGMKWGVRKAYTGDLNVRASRLERVAKGTGSGLDKAVSLGGSNLLRLATSRGLKNESARRAAKYRSRIDRIATGKSRVSDILSAYGSVTINSLIRATDKNTDFER